MFPLSHYKMFPLSHYKILRNHRSPLHTTMVGRAGKVLVGPLARRVVAQVNHYPHSHHQQHHRPMTTRSSKSFVFPPADIPALPVRRARVNAPTFQGSNSTTTTLSNGPPTPSLSESYFPVRRIYCVGRNYAEHAREMGGDPSREAPFFFAKPPDALVPCPDKDDDDHHHAPVVVLDYPLATNNYHHEIELVVALGSAGRQIPATQAADYIWGVAVGVDLTRRDLQEQAKKASRPWETAKAFDQSAPMGPIYAWDALDERMRHLLLRRNHTSSEPPQHLVNNTPCEVWPQGTIWLDVNGDIRQKGHLADMVWSIPEIISHLSHYFHLQPGDLILTGTPAGVGPLRPGDRVRGGVQGLGQISFQVAPQNGG